MRSNPDASRTGAPPRKLVLSVDGAPVITTVVEGLTTFEYARGEYVARVPAKAGERFLRASYPELADLADPRENINPDKRRGLFVDYLEIVGPYAPSRKQPPPSYQRVFVCGHAPGGHSRQCGSKIVTSLLEKAYRRPVTPAEVQAKLQLVELAQKEGDSFEEGIRLALEAVLASPDFLFRIERDPKGTGAGTRPLNDYELASRLSYFLWSSMPDDELLRCGPREGCGSQESCRRRSGACSHDPKAIALADNFAAQWLKLRLLDRKKPDARDASRLWTMMLDAMRRETSLFIGPR